MGLATINYNDGMKMVSKVLENLSVLCGYFSRIYFEMTDVTRIKQADVRATEASLEYRRRKRQERLAADEAVEDGAYAGGAHNFQ